MTALRASQMLNNGTGGLDWAGLPVVCAWLGITDLHGLLLRLSVIKGYSRPTDGDRTGE